MMETEDLGERQGLHQSLRAQMGYGTASLSAASKKPTPRTRKFISRKVSRTDTLMGLALKYSVTVHDLKKENKLWNTDHLFLRETILIPLTAENQHLVEEEDEILVFEGSSSNAASPSSSRSQLLNRDSTDSLSQVSSEANMSQPKTRSQSTPSDFFNKYDTNIAQLKGDVAKMEKHAAVEKEEGSTLLPNEASQLTRKGSNSSNSSGKGRHLPESSDTHSSPILQIRSLTNSRQVKSTLEGHEQINDEIYQL